MEAAWSRRESESVRPYVVAPVRTDPTGRIGPTKKAARGPGWRRTSRGLYVPAEVDGDVPEQRILEAAAVLPSFGGVTGWAGLRWCGALWFDGLGVGTVRRSVTLAVGSFDIRAQRGIAISHEQLRPSDLTVASGLWLTIPERSVLFEMRHATSVESAVVVADMAMQVDLATTEELVAYAATLGTWTGIPQARKALLLVRENSWSPQETRLRLLWVLLVHEEPAANAHVLALEGANG